MPAFTSRDQAAQVFSRLFELLLADDGFATLVREQGLSVHAVHTKPDVEIFVDASGVRVGALPPDAPKAAITIRMSCDTADALWSGRLLLPVAVATGKVRIKGSVAQVLELAPQLHPAFDHYPEVARAAGVAAATT